MQNLGVIMAHFAAELTSNPRPYLLQLVFVKELRKKTERTFLKSLKN
jgi:hypothetical protein